MLSQVYFVPSQVYRVLSQVYPVPSEVHSGSLLFVAVCTG